MAVVTRRMDEKNGTRLDEGRLVRRFPAWAHLTDADGVIVEVSASWLVALCRERAEVVGHPVIDFLTDASRRAVSRVHAPSLRGRPPSWDEPLDFSAADGAIVRTTVSTVPWRVAGGESMWTLSVFTDVSELLRAREGLREAEVTRRHVENRLNRVQRLDALGRCAAWVAHDMNNLLCAVGGLAELALERLEDESPARQDVAHIIGAAEMGKELVARIADYAGHHEREAIAVDVSAAVREAVTLARAFLPKDSRIDARIPADAGEVIADRALLSQVLLNLATNAVHAMEPNTGALEVAVETHEIAGSDADRLGLRPGAHAVVAVADSGHGIDPAHVDRIFEPFFTTKTSGRGTGLGLAAVEDIVAKADGAIDVETELGVGTTFRVYLPLSRGSAFGGTG